MRTLKTMESLRAIGQLMFLSAAAYHALLREDYVQAAFNMSGAAYMASLDS